MPALTPSSAPVLALEEAVKVALQRTISIAAPGQALEVFALAVATHVGLPVAKQPTAAEKNEGAAAKNKEQIFEEVKPALERCMNACITHFPNASKEKMLKQFGEQLLAAAGVDPNASAPSPAPASAPTAGASSAAGAKPAAAAGSTAAGSSAAGSTVAAGGAKQQAVAATSEAAGASGAKAAVSTDQAAAKVQAVQRGRTARKPGGKGKGSGVAGAAPAPPGKPRLTAEEASTRFAKPTQPNELGVVVLCAMGVAAADKPSKKGQQGTSDPYAKLAVRVGSIEHKKQTAVVKKSLEPQWHSAFSFSDVKEEGTRIALEVLDQDPGFMDSDDPLGQLECTLKELLAEGLPRDGRWHTVQRGLKPMAKQKVAATGTVTLMVGWRQSAF